MESASHGEQVVWTKHLEISGLPMMDIAGTVTPLPDGKVMGMVYMQQPDFFAATHVLAFQEMEDAIKWVGTFEQAVVVT